MGVTRVLTPTPFPDADYFNFLVGREFQNFCLYTLDIQPNNVKFPSPLRGLATAGSITRVVPDALIALSKDDAIFTQSALIEVKAVYGDLIPGYPNYPNPKYHLEGWTI